MQAAAARRVLLVPPDRTRLASRAGDITAALYRLLLRLGIAVDVMPALGTHRPMDDADCDAMFNGEIAAAQLRLHRWRQDVTLVGTARTTGHELPIEVNRALIDASYDLVIAIGQVVPHEVAGFAASRRCSASAGGAGTIGRATPPDQRAGRDRADHGRRGHAGAGAARRRFDELLDAATAPWSG